MQGYFIGFINLYIILSNVYLYINNFLIIIGLVTD